MESRWAKLGLKFCKQMKSFGAGMAGGRRRNVDVMTERLIKFRQRLPRFRRLRRIGISTVRLLKTGGKAGMTYAEGILGVSNTMLRSQRRAVAAVAAPASGCGGQNLDAALLVADGGPRSQVDPAYDAHVLSIGEWATAVWEGWAKRCSLNAMVSKANRKQDEAKSPWATVCGPAGGMVASCRRLLWKVHDATRITTDEGRELNLDLDPPAMVKKEIVKAVQRWRWRKMQKDMPKLAKGGDAAGAIMEPIHSLLKSRRNDTEWNPVLRGCLRSVLAKRQYPQVRVKAAGWADHDRCLFCLHDIVKAEATAEQQYLPLVSGECGCEGCGEARANSGGRRVGRGGARDEEGVRAAAGSPPHRPGTKLRTRRSR